MPSGRRRGAASRDRPSPPSRPTRHRLVASAPSVAAAWVSGGQAKQAGLGQSRCLHRTASGRPQLFLRTTSRCRVDACSRPLPPGRWRLRRRPEHSPALDDLRSSLPDADGRPFRTTSGRRGVSGGKLLHRKPNAGSRRRAQADARARLSQPRGADLTSQRHGGRRPGVGSRGNRVPNRVPNSALLTSPESS
jgi:hypothetical protein